MIVRRRPTGLVLLYAMRGSVLPVIAPRLLLVAALSAAAVWLQHVRPGWFTEVNPAPFTLLGLGVSIFLGFRNSACYDRWWEGRKQWGALFSISRSLLRDVVVLLPEAGGARRYAALLVPEFARALRDQLRATVPVPPNRSGEALRQLAEAFAAQMRAGQISDIIYRLFSDHLDGMTSIQTACERLRNTPMPFAYSLMLHRSVWLICLLLPFGMVDTLGMATPLLTLVLAYAFLGLDALGEELEEPFTMALNGLPLDGLVRNIEIAAAEALGDASPEPLAPKEYVLL